MKWLILPLLLLVGAAILVMLVGSVLPATHVAVRRATFAASADAIWAAITAIDEFPSWRPGVQRVERIDGEPGKTAWREVGKHGAIPFELIEALPPRRLVTRIADDQLPFGGSWTYDLSGEGGSTTLTITERGEIRPPLFRFLARFVFGYTGSIDGFIVELGRKFGENVSPS
jgi:uncharacterized protein YndB with AHSA1/START domain